MQGVTTAIVAFLLVCIIYPHLIKNRTQYYAALGIVILIILLDGLGRVVGGDDGKGAFAALAYMIIALLQVGAILVLFMAAGGLSAGEIKGEMANAFEVIRRGEEEKEVIIPRTNEQPKVKEEKAEKAEDFRPPARVEIAAEPPRKPADAPPASIPLE